MFQFKDKNHTIFEKRGYYGVGIFSGKTMVNYGVLMRTAAVFGADFIFTIGQRYKKFQADTTQAHLHIPTFEFSSFDDLKKTIHPNSEIVAIEMDSRSRYVSEFTHPERAIYLLGSEDLGIPDHILKECHHVVKLPGNISLNVAVAGSIVLHDRIAKRKEIR